MTLGRAIKIIQARALPSGQKFTVALEAFRRCRSERTSRLLPGFDPRHALDVRVRVSARLDGRAQNGMADCLKRWIKAERDGEAHLVESPQAGLARLLKRGYLRFLEASALADCKGNAEQFGIAMAPGCSPGNAGRSPEEPDPIASVSIEAAIAQMEWMIRNVDELRAG
jgi:hypothetical protein